MGSTSALSVPALIPAARSVVMAAISAIDIALYDIVGKKLGVPVYNLLGGKVRDELHVYANGWTEGIPHTPEALAKRTKELVA